MPGLCSEKHTWRALQSLIPPLDLLQIMIVAGQVVSSHGEGRLEGGQQGVSAGLHHTACSEAQAAEGAQPGLVQDC